MLLKKSNIYKKIVIGIIGLIAASTILVLIILFGAGISPDSVAYISVARNLCDGVGFKTYEENYFVLQPPLYPLLLASIKILTTIDPMVSSGYLNSILFGLIVYISGLFFLKHLKSFPLVILGTISVLISPAFIEASFMALSELLFILLILLFLIYIEQYHSRQDYLSVLLFSIFSALACLTRYTGVIIILTGITCIILFGKNYKDKLKHSFIFIVISSVPIGAWVARNYFLTETLVGLRASSSFTLFDNITFFFNTVLSWYFPLHSINILYVIVLLITFIWIMIRLISENSSSREVLKFIGPLLIFLFFYSAGILISSTTTAFDQISDRLLSPIYIPLLFLIYFIINEILIRLSRHYNTKIVTVLFIIGILLINNYPFYKSIDVIKGYWEQSGWGYSCNSWRKSETVNYIKLNNKSLKGYKLYSNEPEAVYIYTNLQVKRSPSKTFYNSRQVFKSKPNRDEVWQYGEIVCLIWFDNFKSSFLYSKEELMEFNYMDGIVRFNDGVIYMVSLK